MTIKQQGGIFGRNPSFNNVDSETLSVSGLTTLNGNLNVDNNTLKVDSANNRVGVGGVATPEDTITVAGAARFGSSNTSSAYGQIALGRSGSSTGSHILSGTDGHIRFSNGSSSAGSATERLRILPTGDVKVNTGNLVIAASGQGIDFSATSGTGTSELFDDYEEGTWTPVVAYSTSDGDLSFASQKGSYTKVGNLVTVTGQTTWGETTASGDVSISGLPFSNQSAANSFVGFGVYLDGVTGVSGGVVGRLDPSGTSFRLFYGGTGSVSGLTNSNTDGNQFLSFSFSYQVG